MQEGQSEESLIEARERSQEGQRSTRRAGKSYRLLTTSSLSPGVNISGIFKLVSDKLPISVFFKPLCLQESTFFAPLLPISDI